MLYRDCFCMLSNILSVLIILICVALLTVLVGRKAKIVASIDLASLPQEQEASVRKRLLRDRVDRRLVALKKHIKQLLRFCIPFVVRIGDFWQNLYYRAIASREKAISKENDTSKGATIRDFGSQALEPTQEDDFAVQEKKYIEMIRLDPRSIPAYQGLAELYQKKREWRHCQEALQYLWKLLSTDPSLGESKVEVAYDLWDTYFQQSEFEKALAWIKRAVNLEGSNPRFLDAYIETYIALGNRLHAERAFATLREVNPDNNKLADFQDRIRRLSY